MFRSDLELFGSLRSPRAELLTVKQLLPRRLLRVPKVNAWLNLRRPYPPVRGWVMQQVVKLRAGEEVGADVLPLVDSDLVLVRPVSVRTFITKGQVRFYRNNDAVDSGMPRHVIWHDVARRLLGLPRTGPHGLPDYVSAFNVGDRRVLALSTASKAHQAGHGSTRSHPSSTYPSSSSMACSWTMCSASLPRAPREFDALPELLE